MNHQRNNSTWILLRGLARESRHWGPFYEDFKQAFPEDEVVALDLPGVGEFKDLDSPKSIPTIMEKLRQLILQKQLKPPFKIFSLSLGGMVAMAWLDKYPEEIEKAVIANSSSRISPFYQRLRWEVWKDFFTTVSLPDPLKRESKLLEILSNSPENRKAMQPLWVRLAKEKTVPIKTAIIQLTAASRYQIPKKTFGQHVLVLVALGDKLVEPLCSEALASRFESPIVKHPWAGHELTTDDPDWVITQVQGWLENGLDNLKSNEPY